MVVPVIETDIDAPDGRVLHVYDSGPTPSGRRRLLAARCGHVRAPPGPLVERARGWECG